MITVRLSSIVALSAGRKTSVSTCSLSRLTPNAQGLNILYVTYVYGVSAEAIRTTVVPISGVIGPTVVRIANATGIGYRHDGGTRFSNRHMHTYALNY